MTSVVDDSIIVLVFEKVGHIDESIRCEFEPMIYNIGKLIFHEAGRAYPVEEGIHSNISIS